MENATNRGHYEKPFAKYPDVLDTEEVRAMLGGIAIATVWKLIRRGHLKHIDYLEQCYLIPKDWLIDYILGDHYASYKNILRVQVYTTL